MADVPDREVNAAMREALEWLEQQSNPPYRVEEDIEKCHACGRGPTFLIVGPDNVALGVTYEDRAGADEELANLIEAYAFGLAAGRRK